ncbi:MAG: TIGR01244 family sulfur transferase [Pseudomonadota bacterium]
MSPFIQITPTFSVSPQLEISDIERAKADGFSTIICNRPDGEAPDQPSSADMKQTAASIGLEFHEIPIGQDGIGQDDITRTLALMAAGKPILAYCRSGTRSCIVHGLSRITAGDPVATVIADAGAAGYDLSPYKARFETMAKNGA